MAVTALILGLKPVPEISFHEYVFSVRDGSRSWLLIRRCLSGLVVFYLLYLSWVTVSFSLPACARFPGTVKMLHFASIVQSYTVFAFAFVMLITAKNFGSSPQCNPDAVVVLFRPFSALKSGRIVGWVITVLVVAVYTGVLVKDHMPPTPKLVHQWIQKRVTKQVPTDQDLPLTSPEVAPPPRSVPGLATGKPQYRSQKRTEPIVSTGYFRRLATHDLVAPRESMISRSRGIS
jgi:hypothetical protein